MENVFYNVVISTRIRLARNLSNMPFPTKLKKDQGAIQSTVKAVYDLAKAKYGEIEFIEMDTLSQIDKQALIENHLISTNLCENKLSGAVIVAKDYHLSIMLNEEDHIRAQCLMSGFKINEAHLIIKQLDKTLNSSLPIAFDNQLGYLTSCPTNLGLGMRASVMLFLPGLTLTGKLPQVIKSIESAGLTVRGSYGEGSESIGYMYQISNQRSLGVTADEILERVSVIVKSICESEILMRKALYKTTGIDLEDKIMRAYGNLIYARKITSKEFLQAVSYAKLGVSLGMLELDIDKINVLIEMVQPANLCCRVQRMLNDEERDIERANVIRDTLSK